VEGAGVIVEQPEARTCQIIHVEQEAEISGLDAKDIGRRVLWTLPPTVQPVAKRKVFPRYGARPAGVQLGGAGNPIRDKSGNREESP
jgi:hypothetical protein